MIQSPRDRKYEPHSNSNSNSHHRRDSPPQPHSAPRSHSVPRSHSSTPRRGSSSMVPGPPPPTPTTDAFPHHASLSSLSSSATNVSSSPTPAAGKSSKRLQSLLAGSSKTPSLPDQITYLLADELTNTSLLLSKHRTSIWSSTLESPLRSIENGSSSSAPSVRELREGLTKFEQEMTNRYHEQTEMLQRSLRRRTEAAAVEWEEAIWGRILEHVQELENRVERTQSVMKKPVPLPPVDGREQQQQQHQRAPSVSGSAAGLQGAWRYEELVVEVQSQRSRIAMLMEERARLGAEVLEERARAKSLENAYQAASDGLGDLRQELRLQGVVVQELKQQLEEERERRKGSERALGEERQESRVLKQTLALNGHSRAQVQGLGHGEAVFMERDVKDMEDELLALREEVRRYQDVEAYERDRGEVRMAGRRRAESLYEAEDRRARAARRDVDQRIGRGSQTVVSVVAQQAPTSSRSTSHSHPRRGSYDSALMLQQQGGYPGAFDTNTRHVQFAGEI